MSRTVGRIAELAGVTVRTLHHYDEIGLLSPSERSPAGYRRYTESDVDRLQRILFYRELGFSLEKIATIVDDPATDPTTQLKQQRELLVERIDRLRRMVAAIDRATEANTMHNPLTAEDKLEIFAGFTEPADYAERAEARWGDTPQWAHGTAVTAGLDRAGWEQVERTRRDWVSRLLALVDAGVPADDPAAMDLAEEHRAMLARFLGDCGYPMHRGVTALYVSEPEQFAFLVREPQQRPGLAEFVRDAAAANADRAG